MEAILREVDEQTERFNPFPGLRPFEPDEDHLFFGRERETDELLRRLRTHRFVSVLGTSGSGKSSLVRSGLIPSLYSGFMVQAGSDWRVAILRPGEDPIGNLAQALDHEDVLGGNEEIAAANRVLLESTLRRSDLGLADCVRHAGLARHENLLVVVDQFEELFRFRESRKAHGSRDEAIAFAKLLLGAANQDDVPVYVVITMRSDFIGDCMEYPGLPEAINRGQYLIPRMTRDELRQAITGPVAVGGGQIAPRLVTRLLNEVGDDPDQLPVLQHALMRTWDHWVGQHTDDEALDLRHYESIGTMADALSRHAEEAFDELGGERARAIAEKLFKALTDKRMDDRGVRRPTAVSEAAAIAAASEAEVIGVVEVFRRPGRSFLMPPASVTLDGDSILDLSHESLMRNWRRLEEWVDEETSSGKAYRRLCRAARRYARGQGSLWVEPELSLGLKWRAENAPTAAWAQRYDPTFDRAMRFLDDSKAAEDRRLREEEDARRAKLRRARILAGVLGSAALVTLVFGLLALRAGRIAREAERVATREAETSRAVSDFLVQLFEVADPEEARGATITAQEILDEGARKVDTLLADQPEVQARLMGTIGKVYGSLGLFERAQPLAERARETALTALGGEHAETLAASARLAEIHWNRGQYDDAERLYRESLDGRRKLLGADDPATLRTRAGLAQVYQSQGRFAEAEAEIREALEAQRRVLGDEHEDTLASMHRLGDVLDDLGRYPEAEALLLPAWEAQRRTLGDEHPDTLATMGDLGSLYTALGRYDEAERLYQDDLERRRRILGDEHPKTLVALGRLAELDLDRGRWRDAESRNRTVLEARQRLLGKDHPSTIESQARLAWVYRLTSRLDEAFRLARDASTTADRVFGAEHPKSRETANTLAAVYMNQGRYDRAEAILAQNLEIYQRLYGDAHPDTRAARNNLAVVYSDWGRQERAEALYRENYELTREALGEDNPSTLFYLKNLVYQLNRERRRDEAEAMAVDMLERYRRVLGDDNPDTIDAINAMAVVYRSQKKFEEARKLLTERLDGNRRVFGDQHPRTMWSLATLAGLRQQLGEYEESVPLRQTVLETSLALFGEEHPDTIGAYGALGWLYETLNRPDEALELRRKALDIQLRLATREEAGAHDKHRYAASLVWAQKELQDPPEAVRFALAANEMSDYSNRDYVATLAEAYFRDGRVKRAIETQRRALALVPEDDTGARNRMEGRLGEFYRASGDTAMVRQAQIDELARLREAAEKPDASPRARNSYAWALLTADPADLQDHAAALRVSLAVNEETGRSDHQLLDTLGLAQYLNGDVESAVETMQQILSFVPEDDVWAHYRFERRKLIFESDESRRLTAGTLLGDWLATFGPVRTDVNVERDGKFLVGRILTGTQWRPADSILFRFDEAGDAFDILEVDAGFTNQRFEPGDYRITEAGDVIFWNPKGWFPLHLSRP